MGTDIHSIAQVRRNTPSTAQWETVAVSICGDPRGYNTFAMLANVRNGTGFAGIKTSNGFPVIHEQRGLPEDLEVEDDNVKVELGKLLLAWDWNGNVVSVTSDEASGLRYMEDATYWLGEHSHSWCTLAELRKFCAEIASKYTTMAVGNTGKCDTPINALEHSNLGSLLVALETIRDRCSVTDDDVRYVFGFDS